MSLFCFPCNFFTLIVTIGPGEVGVGGAGDGMGGKSKHNPWLSHPCLGEAFHCGEDHHADLRHFAFLISS